MFLKPYWAFINFFSPYDDSLIDHMTVLKTRIGISFGLIGTIFVFMNGAQWLEFNSFMLAGLDISTGVAFVIFLFLLKFGIFG